MRIGNWSRWLIVAAAASGILGMSTTGFAKGKKGDDCDVMLRQSDFNDGTYMIRTPGTYCLKENVSFNPNNAKYLRQKLGNPSITAYEASFPLRSQLGFEPGQYDPSAFGIGFFAAIAVASPDVVIDLKGKTIEQSEEHALLMRFFAVIETADRPFISGQGPHDFGTIVGAAENLVIKNGTIGRSSHHGIHGNRAKDVTIENVKFKDFEVAAVALNGVEGLTLKNLTARSRKDVPVLGQFSTAQFIKPYVDFLVLTNSATTFRGMSAAEIQADLKAAVNNVHEDLIVRNKPTISKAKHLAEWRMFHNKAGVVDGNSYGFLINGVGVAVNGFPLAGSTPAPSSDVTIKNVRVDFLKANIREIPGIAADGATAKVANDPVGSLFQLMAVDPTGASLALTVLGPMGSYKGNVVTNAQALVAKAAANGEFPAFLNVSRNSITPQLIAWAESSDPLSSYLSTAPGPHGTGFVCNGDQMFHSNKGVVAFKLDGGTDIKVENAVARNVTNTGAQGTDLCGAYQKSHPGATLVGYGGAATRAMSLAGSTDADIDRFTVVNLVSEGGSAIGIDVLTDSSDVAVKNFKLLRARGSRTATDLPTAPAEAIGIRVGADTADVSVDKYCALGLKAEAGTAMLQDLSGSAAATKACK